MKILITGQAGFIGYHTAIKFKEMGHEVIGFDNFNDIVYDSAIKRDRVSNLLKNYNIETREIDLSDEDLMNDLFEQFKPDLVIHLAAHAGVRVSLDTPVEYIDNNIRGTQHLINVIEKNNVENVIYASTSCTMEGNPLPWGPDDKLGPQLNPYGYSKQTNENQFTSSKIKHVAGLRFFTVYGPWGRPDMALYIFAENISNGKPIIVYNNGDMVRDFTYVDDVVQGIVLVSQNMTPRDVYCIGYGDQVQLMDFVRYIEENLGKVAEKDYQPRHPADALETWSDTTKLQKLGYKPTTPIDVGVKNFIEWYLDYHGSK